MALDAVDQIDLVLVRFRRQRVPARAPQIGNEAELRVWDIGDQGSGRVPGFDAIHLDLALAVLERVFFAYLDDLRLPRVAVQPVVQGRRARAEHALEEFLVALPADD